MFRGEKASGKKGVAKIAGPTKKREKGEA